MWKKRRKRKGKRENEMWKKRKREGRENEGEGERDERRGREKRIENRESGTRNVPPSPDTFPSTKLGNNMTPMKRRSLIVFAEDPLEDSGSVLLNLCLWELCFSLVPPL